MTRRREHVPSKSTSWRCSGSGSVPTRGHEFNSVYNVRSGSAFTGRYRGQFLRFDARISEPLQRSLNEAIRRSRSLIIICLKARAKAILQFLSDHDTVSMREVVKRKSSTPHRSSSAESGQSRSAPSSAQNPDGRKGGS